MAVSVAMIGDRGIASAGGVERPARLAALLARLTPEDKLALVQLRMPRPQAGQPTIVALPGIPRVGLPTVRMALEDAGGAASPLALMASWDVGLAHRVGQASARSVRATGQAILPVGGVGPTGAGRARDGEDPLLAGSVMGAMAAGLMSGHVLPLFGGDDAGTGATPPSMTEDRMLGLYLAIGQARGGGILCRAVVAAAHPCGDMDGMGRTIRDGWRFGGMVAEVADREADGDGASRLPFLLASIADGVDLEGAPAADGLYVVALRQALRTGAVPWTRLDAMAERILRTLDESGVIDRPPPYVAPHGASSPASARDPLLDEEVAEGAVLLQNENAVLPLGGTQAAPVLVVGTNGTHDAARAVAEAMRRTGLGVRVAADSPGDGVVAADAAKADRVLVFSDGPQDDRLIAAIAGNGGHVVVVLLSDDPDRPMPWLDLVDGVVQAWSWRGGGASALAALLTGQRDFAGRLPATFTGGRAPADFGRAGYKAFDRAHVAPLFPFGYGLSNRARFAYSDLRVTRDGTRLVVSFGVTNAGSGAGRDVPQVYLDLPAGAGDAPKRLVGWRTVQLAPGQGAHLSVGIDAHLLGHWNAPTLEWVVPAGDYAVSLGPHSANLVRQVALHLPEMHVPGTLPPVLAADSTVRDE
ncbi:glycoside hydrolase family 3 C-terminal domain-containing protein [Gluconacetobacter tumulisoli]|uniref:Beta-glucosidase n=1 Tax=Gluconacetobacter tumulisoli TaxID=1286189 RepID=A0A7W4PMK4_9PROT|nr:glycoside hydrolase family 3 C-terminal domain-containing protein [Gluconacetobacter tumulisoli]MBB2203078.1 beta-glucosidase [Gluconacetobacter tumulisoli]